MMKRLLLALALTLPAGLLGAADYGQPIDPAIAPVPLAQVLADPDTYQDQTVAVSGRIAKVCQKKGCWIMLTDGDAAARVMTGHEYFLPKDASGEAVAIGTLSAKVMDQKQAEHMTQDGGDGAAPIAAGSTEWRLLASSIRVLPAATEGANK
jgi:hypothetical protein